MSNQFDTFIAAAGRNYGVDPLLVKAIVAAESNFNPSAYRAEPQIGDASYGLMQTLYATARDMGYSGPPEGLFDPETSLAYGTKYLSRQLVRYGGDLAKAVSAYNAGRAISSNAAYVNRVLGFYSQYRQAAQGSAGQTTPAGAEIVPGVLVPTLPPVKLAAGEDENGRRLVTMETLLTPQTAPYVIGGLAILGALVFSGRRR